MCGCVLVYLYAEGREQVTGSGRNPSSDVRFTRVSAGVLCIHVRVFGAYTRVCVKRIHGRVCFV